LSANTREHAKHWLVVITWWDSFCMWCTFCIWRSRLDLLAQCAPQTQHLYLSWMSITWESRACSKENSGGGTAQRISFLRSSSTSTSANSSASSLFVKIFRRQFPRPYRRSEPLSRSLSAQTPPGFYFLDPRFLCLSVQKLSAAQVLGSFCCQNRTIIRS
jgi:hypothetical protein